LKHGGPGARRIGRRRGSALIWFSSLKSLSHWFGTKFRNVNNYCCISFNFAAEKFVKGKMLPVVATLLPEMLPL